MVAREKLTNAFSQARAEADRARQALERPGRSGREAVPATASRGADRLTQSPASIGNASASPTPEAKSPAR